MTVVPSFPQVEMVCIPLGKVLMGQEYTIIQVGCRYELCFREAQRESNELCCREAARKQSISFQSSKIVLIFPEAVETLIFSEFLK